MSIHTIGDSHAIFGWPSWVKVHWLGPVLCHSFGTDPIGRCKTTDFNLQNGDTLIFCFGEIDCRCHVHKYVSESKSYKEIIDELVKDYIEAIHTVVASSGIQYKNIFIYNVVPTVKKEIIRENPEYPHLGTNAERKEYVLYFNSLVSKACSENGFKYFDIYEAYCDKEGFLQRNLSDGIVHITNGTYLEEYLKKRCAEG
jgi:hypothetical protein